MSSIEDTMAVSPEAAGSEGLAAAETGASAGGTIDPLDNVRSIFTTIGMTTTQRDDTINAHNLTGMDTFYYIRVNDTGSFIKVWNDTSLAVATKVGMPTQRKMQAFLYWYHEQLKRGIIPAAADFDATAMRLAVNKFNDEKYGKELDLTDLDPGKIELDLKWWPFKEAFLNMANHVMGVDNNRIYDVIRPDQPSVWVPPNAFEQRMYQLPHTGALNNRNKKMVRGNIFKASMNTPSWEWIKEFEVTEYSRPAWKLLVENARDKLKLTSGYCLQLELSPSFQMTGEYSTAMSTNSYLRSTSLSCSRRTPRSPVTIMLCHTSFLGRGCFMECRYQTHLTSTWPRLMFLTIYWEIGCGPSLICTPRWQSNSFQGC